IGRRSYRRRRSRPLGSCAARDPAPSVRRSSAARPPRSRPGAARAAGRRTSAVLASAAALRYPRSNHARCRLCLPATPITTSAVFRDSRVGYIGPDLKSETRATVDGRYAKTRRKGIYLLPNLLTTGGLFAGFYSIVASIDGNFSAAAWAIFAAMLLDGLDGRVARLTSTASEFGKEFDSLADMV